MTVTNTDSENVTMDINGLSGAYITTPSFPGARKYTITDIITFLLSWPRWALLHHKGSFTLSENERKGKMFSLIFVAAHCEH